MAYQCPTCPKRVRGKKKGQCKDCRTMVPFEPSNKGQEPFNRSERMSGKKSKLFGKKR